MTDDQRAGAALLPCAHCNGEPMQQRKEQEGYGPGFAILCTGCACATPWVEAMADAFTLWNRRASDKREGEGDELSVECAEFLFATYAFEDDANLTGDAQELKRRLRAAARLDKPAGEAGGWVKCSERMPSEAGRVLVYLPATLAWRDPHVGMAFYSKDEDNFASLDNYIGASAVTHWAPLPKPPEPKTGES